VEVSLLSCLIKNESAFEIAVKHGVKCAARESVEANGSNSEECRVICGENEAE